MSQETILWIVIIAVIAVPLLIAALVYFSRSHDFPSYHDQVHRWHPGGRFTDSDGRDVTDPVSIANLQRAWKDHVRGF